jgi:hypothetical protein
VATASTTRKARSTSRSYSGNQPQGDFFIDLIVTDRAGNSLTYDKVYGFSTEPFSKRANLLFVPTTPRARASRLNCPPRPRGRNDPFVVGFSNLFVSTMTATFGNAVGLPPVEATICQPSGIGDGFSTISGNGTADATTFSPPGSPTFGTAPTSVDVYRILSRGR